jgi:hypothetical protein
LDKEAANLIAALRHFECGLSQDCCHNPDNQHDGIIKAQIEWCTRAGKWLDKNKVTAKDLKD